MKKLFPVLITLLFINSVNAQILEPAEWTLGVSDKEVRVGEETELIFKAVIDHDWYMYSSDFDPDLGPMLTEFTFEPNPSYELVGELIPVNPKTKYDEIWEGDIRYFKGEAEFRQKVRILTANPLIKGSYTGQVCSDVDGKCILFGDDFTFKDIKVVSTDKEKTEPSSTDESIQTPIIQTTDLKLPGSDVSESIEEIVPSDYKKNDSGLLKARDSHSPYSLLSFMIVAFLAGLAALFTPCVFPMIPMTVSFFTGKAKTRSKGIRNALIYGFSIVFIYTLVGSVVAPFMGPEIANELATNWIPNVLFFIIFVVFAISFFGLFEITLPNSWVNKADQQADKGGFSGIFFMAFTLVLVSFSCTGPIVGSILVQSAGGQILKPVLGMFAFSMAFAVPFTLFAIFPEWLNSLPKSGGWLNSVKVVLGFIELAFAFKFLSIADQAYHWNILDREVYLAIWIVIFGLLGLYLLGKVRLPHDSPTEVIGVPRLILSIIVFSFVVYLIPGMFGAPLKALAGYLPPISTHDFNLAEMGNMENYNTALNEEKLCDKPKYSDFLHFPHGIKGYFDYDQALACAKETDKPIFIDFTGHGCVNCREMEARVWSDPAVLQMLKNDFIVLALYVDDKTELPESEWYTSAYDNKIKKTIGKQNADLQISKFNNNAQPFYIIMDHDEQMLLEPKAYDLSISNFMTFLQAGVQAFGDR